MNLYAMRQSVAYLPTSALCPLNEKLCLLFMQVLIFKKSAVSQTRTQINQKGEENAKNLWSDHRKGSRAPRLRI